MLVKFSSSIGYSGANREEEVELPDDYIGAGFNIIDGGD